MDDAPAGSLSASRSRLSRASSSCKEEDEVGHEEEEVPDVHLEHDEDDAQDVEEEGYPGGPSNTSMLIYFHDHVARRVWEEEEWATIKSVNHARKIFDLFKPQAQWFNDVVVHFGLGGLCMTEYSTINHGMQGVFAERWHKETSYFYLSVGELMITLHDVACLLHLPINWRLLDHSRIQRVEAIKWMVDHLGMDPNMEDYECRETSEAHIRLFILEELYQNHLVAAAESEEEGDGLFVEYHRSWIISYFHCIHGYDPDLAYIDAMPRAARYVL
ncbi:serine/threonine-protein phosphatase 7 long form homolog [Vicia villosa]|uniref:serine/threonine-protein phosphatase 7 long form homolog n=1 Tax=Vicia villosa TaxID=3911 RepID=UPI00273AC4B3|nr:serine/threonine-protein phosphatase 7 long form homolog [Vicia villosa]